MRFHHLALVVPDMDAAIRFFAEALDCVVVFSGSWSQPTPLMDRLLGLEGSAARSSLLKGPCGFLELFEFASPKAGPSAALPPHHPGLRHRGIE